MKTHRKKGKFHKNHRITKAKKHKSTQRKNGRNKKAGAYLGRGAFGIVFAEPRIPCSSETVDEIKDLNQVSKLFERRAIQSAREEGSVRDRLNQVDIEGEVMTEFEKHAIVPKKLCRVKKEAEENGTKWFEMAPYTDDSWRKNEHTGEFMNNINLESIPQKYPYMIIAERGNNDLLKEFGKIRDEEDFYQALIRMDSVIDGVKILNEHGMVHPDLKDKNCVRVGDTYKMIDLADVKDFTVFQNWGTESDAFMYYAWPSTNIWLSILDANATPGVSLRTPRITGRVNRTLEELEELEDVDEMIRDAFITRKKANINNFKNTTLPYFYAFMLSEEEGFTDDEVAQIRKFGECYMCEKTLGTKFELNRRDLSNVFATIESPELRESSNYSKVIQAMNHYFVNLANEDIELFAEDIITRLQLHSIGVMLLQTIFYLLRSLRRRSPSLLAQTPRLRRNILMCHVMARKFYLQNDVITTNGDEMKFSLIRERHVFSVYKRFVDTIKSSLSIIVSDAESSDSDDEESGDSDAESSDSDEEESSD